MWEVVATKVDGRTRTKVVTDWKHGMKLAGRAMEMGWKVSILPYFVDCFIVDEEGELYRVASRISPNQASRYVVQWAKKDRNQSGCIAWPHAVPLPSGWRVVKQDSSC